MRTVYPILSFLISFLLLSACSPDSITIEEQSADKVGDELTQQAHSNYAVNGMLHVEGMIESKEKLSADYAWIQIRFFDENYSSPLDGTQDHYVSL